MCRPRGPASSSNDTHANPQCFTRSTLVESPFVAARHVIAHATPATTHTHMAASEVVQELEAYLSKQKLDDVIKQLVVHCLRDKPDDVVPYL